MAHHRIDLLQRLINALDHENNDIYIHLDIKCEDQCDIQAQYSKVIMIPRMDVRWAGYSQIQCEFNLIKAALSSNQQYQYYHLLTGASYPIKDLNYIFEYFEKNSGKEFIGFVPNPSETLNRVRYKYVFNEVGKPISPTDYRKVKIRNTMLRIQEKIGVDFFKKYKLEYQKGLSYWSITEECARYIIENEELVRRMLKHSLYGDEVFVQTLVYNSRFLPKVYTMENEYNGALFCAGWKECVSKDRKGQPEPNLIMDDYNYFRNPEYLFALKFEGVDGLKLLDKIDTEILHK